MAAWLVLPASIPVISSESSEHMNNVFQCCYSVITFVTYTVLITLENSFASDYLPHLRCCPVWKQFWWTNGSKLHPITWSSSLTWDSQRESKVTRMSFPRESWGFRDRRCSSITLGSSRSLLEPTDLQPLKAGPSELGQDSCSRYSINGSGRWFHQTISHHSPR